MRAILKIKLTVILIVIALNSSMAQNGWIIQSPPTTQNLKDVFFITNKTGFAVGDSGLILKTTNGGNLWTSQSSGTIADLNSIQFLNLGTGYTAGTNGVFLYTLDSGITWQQLNLNTTRNLNAVHFLSSNEGFIVGDSILLSTFNGGQEWETKNLINSLLSICFPDAAVGYALLNQGGMYKTSDGGYIWKYYTVPGINSPKDVYFTGVSTGYITGASPNNIIKTSDGGINWTSVHSGANRLNSVTFIGNKGFTAGENGTVYKTTDEGLIWSSQFTGTTKQINSIYFVDSLYGFAVGDNGLVLATKTGGDLLTHKVITGEVRYFENNSLVTNGYVKAVKYSYNTTDVVTIDSAQIDQNGKYIIKVPFGDSTDIMAYQDDEQMDYVPTYYPSTTKWQDAHIVVPMENRSNVNIFVYKSDTNFTPSGYLAGKIYKSIYRLESNILPKSVIYVKHNDKFIGSAFADTNGHYKIELPAGNFKVYVNRLGYSSDSSNITINPPGGNLDSANFYLQKITSGINPPVVTRVYYYLGQNYPNPFNPATIIQYVLGSSTLVKLTVYDISGKKIKELENSEKGPGTHSVEFDGRNLPSGVYFYKIVTDNYSATKSMVLIK